MPLRLRPDITTTSTKDGLILLDERSGRYWQLNSTGAHVLQALINGEQPEQIIREIAMRYCIDPHQAHHDVTVLTSRLHGAKLVCPS